MGVEYRVFAEVNIDGKWYNLSPNFIKKDGSPVTGPLFWACSDFSPVNYDLRDFCLFRGVPDDMSGELKDLLHADADFDDSLYRAKTWREYYKNTMYCVNFAQAVVPHVKKEKQFKYEGYVLKYELAAFECEDLDEFTEWLTQEEYDELEKDEQRLYAFYRWNDYSGKYWIYNTIAQRVWVLCDLFEEICSKDIGGSIWHGIADSQVRLFVDVED